MVEPDSHVVNFENRWRTRSGEYRWLRWSARSDGETWFSVAFDVTERKHAEESLRRALAEDRLVAYAQPIAEHSGRVAQEELLVRMLAEERADPVLEPRQFLPLAERSGLIVAIDRWMAGRGIELAASGRPAEINLSAVSICDEELPADLATRARAGGGRCRQRRLRDHRDRGDGRTSTPPATSSTGSAGSAAASRSTTSAPASDRSPTCATCRCST